MNEPGKLIPLHGGYRKLKSFQVAQLAYVVAAQIAAIPAEVSRRRTEARRLRSSAGAEWTTAKAHFEQELLGEKP
jgi:hypothetical protein